VIQLREELTGNPPAWEKCFCRKGMLCVEIAGRRRGEGWRRWLSCEEIEGMGQMMTPPSTPAPQVEYAMEAVKQGSACVGVK